MGEDRQDCMGTRRHGSGNTWGQRRMTKNQTNWSMAMVAATFLVGSAVAVPANERPGSEAGPDGTHPGYVLNIIADLGTILKQRQKDLRYVGTESTTEDSEKRGIDFGLGRGYSGSQVKTPKLFQLQLQHVTQAARHMLGLQQASFAGGPGKRKRSGYVEERRGMGPVIIAVPVQEE